MRVSVSRAAPARRPCTSGRASDQRTRAGRLERDELVRASRRRRRARAATTRPRGTSPSSRFEPSGCDDPRAARAESTSRRPCAGSEKSAGCGDCLDCSRRWRRARLPITARPGGESAAAISDHGARRAAIGRQRPRRPRRQRARAPRSRRGRPPARRRASSSPGTTTAPSERLERRVTPSSSLPSRSSPRRSRELTVPRGRSSSSAISPGV